LIAINEGTRETSASKKAAADLSWLTKKLEDRSGGSAGFL
jgi:hypothetical protein